MSMKKKKNLLFKQKVILLWWYFFNIDKYMKYLEGRKLELTKKYSFKRAVKYG